MKVSVIIPFYKNPQLFIKTLHSLFNQVMSDIEFVFINDGSTEIAESLITEIFEKFSGNNHKLKIIKNESNKGISYCRKLGLKNSSGEYVAFCDSDDFVEPHMYLRLYEEAIRTNADIITCSYYIEKNESKIINKEYGYDKRKIFNDIYGKCEIALWDKLFKRELLIKNAIYPLEKNNYYEDCFMTIKAIYYAKKIVTIPDSFYHYVSHPNSSSKKNFTDNLKSMKNYIDELEIFFKKHEENPKLYKNLINRLKFQYKLKIKNTNLIRKNDWYNLYNETHSQIFRFIDIPFLGRLKLYLLIKIKMY